MAINRVSQRSRTHNRYVFSLTNSKRNVHKRPKLSSEIDNNDFSILAEGGAHLEVPRERERQKRRRRKRSILAVFMGGLIVIYCMDGMYLYNESNSSNLDHLHDLNIGGGNKESEGYESNFQSGMRGGEKVFQPAVSGLGNNIIGDEVNIMPKYAPISAYVSDKNSNALSSHDTLLNDVAGKVADLLRDDTMRFDDMKLVVGFDGSNASRLNSRSSGLKLSPGEPFPDQEIEMDRKMKYKPSKQLLSRIQTKPHEITGLHCNLYGGPNSNIGSRDLVYWQDISSDDTYLSPFFHENRGIADDDTASFKTARDSYSKYITFEPDPGGFNNNRMAFELYLVLSAAMGRTLVLPPKHKFPLLIQGSEKEQILSMEDFFHLHTLTKEIKGVNIITMEEFLKREAAIGHITRYASDEKLLPPHNETVWDYRRGGPPQEELWEYIRTVGYRAETWNNDCVGAFPSDASGNSVLVKMMDGILSHSDYREFPNPLDYQGRPVPLSAPPNERLREILAERRRLCLYSNEMQDATLVHFPSGKEARLFMQFYAFSFFEDPRQASWSSRLIRDHLRYKDVIMCAAARIIEALKQQCHSASNPTGTYHSLHLRRTEGSFGSQYKKALVSSEELMQSLSIIEANSTIFVSSDEKRDHQIFKELSEKYNIVMLETFQNLVDGLNPNFHGMVEQMIAAKAGIFFGTYYSTYSGFISRLRGYYSVQNEEDGIVEGILRNTFYITSEQKNEYAISKAVQKPFFSREFPIAWRNINRGLKGVDKKWKLR